MKGPVRRAGGRRTVVTISMPAATAELAVSVLTGRTPREALTRAERVRLGTAVRTIENAVAHPVTTRWVTR